MMSNAKVQVGRKEWKSKGSSLRLVERALNTTVAVCFTNCLPLGDPVGKGSCYCEAINSWEAQVCAVLVKESGNGFSIWWNCGV